jgi:NitT/TauT family transport system substrate-binding protein
MLSLLILTGCSSKDKKEITISTSQWIGYAPLFYAYDKGYLDPLHIKIINSASLAEAANIFRVGKANMVTTTQHEYYSLKEDTHNIVPVILMDRSNGGDMVLSNKSISFLQKAKKIFAYLEIDSINQEIIKDFIRHNNLDIKKIIFINKDQKQIQDVKYVPTKPTIIVTYCPYNTSLEAKGFHELASTKNIDSIVVIDALCATKDLVKYDKTRLIKLKHILDKSISEIQNNTKDSHQVVSKYLSNITYKNYVQGLQNIKWINKPSPDLLHFISKLDYKEDTIIK